MNLMQKSQVNIVASAIAKWAAADRVDAFKALAEQFCLKCGKDKRAAGVGSKSNCPECGFPAGGVWP